MHTLYKLIFPFELCKHMKHDWYEAASVQVRSCFGNDSLKQSEVKYEGER